MRQLQKSIINMLKVKPQIDPQEEVDKRVQFISEFLQKTGMTTLVLGISGVRTRPWQGGCVNWPWKSCGKKHRTSTTNSSRSDCHMANRRMSLMP